MAETDISICARALVLLGAEPISSFEDEVDTARICALVYPNLKSSMMSRYGWRFLMRKAKLSRENGAPVATWQYKFIIPGEAISIPHAVFSSAQGRLTTNEFEVFQRRVLTNYPELWMDYVATVPESEWPAWFVDLMTKAMCAEIAFGVTDQQNVADGWNAKAYGTPSEAGQGGAFGEAMTLDAQGNGNIGIYDGAFVDARFGGFY